MGIRVVRWNFWSPEEDDPSAWFEYWQKDDAAAGPGEPDASSIPRMRRRRTSRLTRMALAAALEVIGGETPDYSVFCSQHGEIVRTRAILAGIVAGEEISPTAFSQSVHNTSSGLYTIIAGSGAASTSIAAGGNTFAAGWVDAQAWLRRNPAHKVLLVDFDEVIPAEYGAFSGQTQCDHALALLLVAADGGVSIDRTSPGEAEALPQGPRFLAWLQGPERELCMSAEGQGWRWRR